MSTGDETRVTDPPDVEEDEEEWEGDGDIFAIEASLGHSDLVVGSRIVITDDATADELAEALLKSIRGVAASFSSEVMMALELRLLHGDPR